MPYSFVEFPLCGLTYTLTPTLPFVSFNTALSQVTVMSTNPGDRGTYPLKLDANAAMGVSKQVEFTVLMADICKSAVFF